MLSVELIQRGRRIELSTALLSGHAEAKMLREVREIYDAIVRGRVIVESRSRNRCRDCGDHVEAEAYDVNVEKGFTELDVVWCRQCFHWVGLKKGSVRQR
jgi:hypothetical protein